MSIGGGTIRRVTIVGSAALLLLPPFPAQAGARQRFDGVTREIQRLIAERELPSVAVAVARDGCIVWETAFGWADREAGAPATPHTPYSLASVSKPFTATAVMKLVESGRLQLDRPANDYLGDARLRGRHLDRATLRRMLTHMAGLPPFFRMRWPGDTRSFEETIASSAILTHPPGQRYVYSNLGYGLLDYIIERVSGVSYVRFMRSELFEPLRLERTFVPNVEPPPDAAVRYGADDRPLPFYDLDHRGASSVYASAHDLVRFGMFHLNDRRRDDDCDRGGDGLLQARSIREMQRVHTWTNKGEGYGLGWRIEDDQRGFRHVGHTGGMPGVTTVLSLFPAERLVVVVLANKRSDSVVPLARRVVAAMMPSYAWRMRQMSD